MKDIDGVLTGFDSMLHFLEHNDGVDNYKEIWELESYKKSMRRHLYALLPSCFFILVFSTILLSLINSLSKPEDHLFILILLIVLIGMMFYFMLVDIDRFRLKHDKFIKGSVVGKTREKGRFFGRYYLVLLLDSGKIIAARVPRKEYLASDVNKLYWIFLEYDDLYAIKI